MRFSKTQRSKTQGFKKTQGQILAKTQGTGGFCLNYNKTQCTGVILRVDKKLKYAKKLIF